MLVGETRIREFDAFRDVDPLWRNSPPRAQLMAVPLISLLPVEDQLWCLS